MRLYMYNSQDPRNDFSQANISWNKLHKKTMLRVTKKNTKYTHQMVSFRIYLQIKNPGEESKKEEVI